MHNSTSTFLLPLSVYLSVFSLLGKGCFLRSTSCSTSFGINTEKPMNLSAEVDTVIGDVRLLCVAKFNARMVVVVVCFCGYRWPKMGG